MRSLLLCGCVLMVAGCALPRVVPPPAPGPVPSRSLIDRALPAGIPERAGWIADINSAFSELGIQPTRERVCAVIAVTAQESGFRVDPMVPGLGPIAWREIDSRAQRAGVPRAVVHAVLQLKSPTGRSYSDRIDDARTEKQLSDVFEDFTGSIPLGRTLFASWNPVRTRGPMQVNVTFAEKFAAAERYPYPVNVSIADELFTRRGSLYFGIAHLLAYTAPYDRYLYRFADFNAGQYASRNAAFQNALGIAAGTTVLPDGALLARDGDSGAPGNTESVLRALADRLDIADSAIHSALERGRTAEFENVPLYRRVFALAEKVSGRAPPVAILPRIKLQGPKISRHLTTAWYAQRVDERFSRCLSAQRQ